MIAHAQWRKVPSFNGSFYNEVFFFDNAHGWITQASTTVYRTNDGGVTWQTSTLPGGGGSPNRDICFVSPSDGFVSGSDGIWKTANGGASWQNITPPSFNNNGSTSCWFTDVNNGVFGGGNCNDVTVNFYRTTNGGASWDSVQYTHATDVAVGGIASIGGVYYAAGGSGKFWKSSDGGATWTLTNTGSNGWQEDLVSFGNGLYIASADGSSCGSTGSGKLLRSVDNGATWVASSFPGVVMWGISMYSTTEGWGCGDGGNAYKTTDGGVTWTLTSCGMDRRDRLDDIFFSDATHGWAVGDGVYKFGENGFTVHPDTINFGDVIVGTRSRDSNAVITAIGSALAVSNRVIAGLDASQFNSSGALGPQNLASCQDGLTPLYFLPTSEGPKLARLVYTIAGTNETAEVYLKGRGVRPRIAAPTTLLFDTLICGDTELDTVWVKNSGNYPLKITSAIASVLQGASFRVVSPSLSQPVTIAPGDSTRFILQVQAASTGTFSSTLALASNDPDSGKSPWNIQLNVVRKSVAVALSQDSVDMPPMAIDSESNVCIVYHNSGDGDQTIQSIAFVGGDGVIHQLPSVSGIFVGKGRDQSICFRATVGDTLVHIARFRVRTLPCNRDTIVTVRYQARNPVISTVPAKMFGDVVCDSTTTDTIIVRNNGNAPLILNKPYFNGANGLKYSLAAPLAWPDTIPIGDSLVVTVALTGDVPEGDYPVTMIFPSNDRFPGKSLWSIEARYHRGRSELTPSRRVVDVGDVCINGVRVERVFLRNTGSATAAVSGVTPIGPTPDVIASGVPVGVAITPAATDSLTFTITPLAAGPFTAQFLLGYGPCERRDTIWVVGRGVGIALAATPPSLDYGSSGIGRSVQRSFTVANNGAAPATITAWVFQPAIPNARVISPQPPFKLAPGATQTVVVELTPADTGNLTLKLLGAADGPCPDTLRTTIDVRGIKGTVVTDRYRVDYGSLFSCSGGAVPDSIRLVNYGTSPITLRAVRLAAAGASSFRIENGPGSPVTIAAGDSVTLIVSALVNAGGSVVDTLLFELDQPDQPVIAVPLAARLEKAALAVNDAAGLAISSLSFSSLAGCNPSDDKIVRLHNGGTVADTIALAIEGATFSLGSPATLILPAGADTTVTVRAAMSAPGTASGTLTVTSLPCSLTSRVALDARYGVVAGAVADLDFSKVNIGRTIELTTTITNTGEADQVIDHLEVDPPSAGYAIVGTYAGMPLPAKASLPVTVSFSPVATGAAPARIVAVMREPCFDTLRATLDGIGIRSNVFLATRGIAYGERLLCQDSCATLRVEGVGNEPVTILSAGLEGAGSGGYTISAGNLPLVIEPGSSAEITVCFDPAAATTSGDAFAVLATDDSAQPLLRMKLTGTRGSGLTGPSSIDFLTGDADTTIIVANGSAVPIVIDGATTASPFTLLTAMPITVPPHDSVAVRVRYVHAGIDGGKGALLLRQAIPCLDSLTVALFAPGDERYPIVLAADTVSGRWGEHARIPIVISNTRGGRAEAFDLAITASPGLLDPTNVAIGPSLAGRWSVSRSAYDATTGTLMLHVASAEGLATLPSTDTLLTVGYLVLRGGLISTDLGLDPSGLPATITATTIPGAFVLADYCDAYGRLLRVRGDVALDQNIPNPFNPTTTIEFETAFDGPVRLTVYDELGREVKRLIDEQMPAGRRRVVVDASDLPSGIYTYRLTTGLQTLTRRMVVAK
jgi:photosystem II stability/assembly factor-like uncharacterized protein